MVKPGVVIPILIGIGGGILLAANTVAAVILLCVAAIWLLVLTPPIRDRLPTVAANRGPGDTVLFGFQLHRPRRSRKSRLRNDAMQFAADVHAFRSQHPSTGNDDPAGWLAYVQAKRNGASDAEAQPLYEQWVANETAIRDKQTSELKIEFGGRLEDLLTRFAAFGMLDDDNTDARLTFLSQNRSHLHELASRIEGMARRL